MSWWRRTCGKVDTVFNGRVTIRLVDPRPLIRIIGREWLLPEDPERAFAWLESIADALQREHPRYRFAIGGMTGDLQSGRPVIINPWPWACVPREVWGQLQREVDELCSYVPDPVVPGDLRGGIDWDWNLP